MQINTHYSLLFHTFRAESAAIIKREKGYFSFLLNGKCKALTRLIDLEIKLMIISLLQTDVHTYIQQVRDLKDIFYMKTKWQ